MSSKHARQSRTRKIIILYWLKWPFLWQFSRGTLLRYSQKTYLYHNCKKLVLSNKVLHLSPFDNFRFNCFKLNFILKSRPVSQPLISFFWDKHKCSWWSGCTCRLDTLKHSRRGSWQYWIRPIRNVRACLGRNRMSSVTAALQELHKWNLSTHILQIFWTVDMWHALGKREMCKGFGGGGGGA
jgi:hypothetical protein